MFSTKLLCMVTHHINPIIIKQSGYKRIRNSPRHSAKSSNSTFCCRTGERRFLQLRSISTFFERHRPMTEPRHRTIIFVWPGIRLVHKCCRLYSAPRRSRRCSLDDHRRHGIWMMMMMMMMMITCQYTGHCCMLPLSLHKRRVVEQLQQHLGRVHCSFKNILCEGREEGSDTLVTGMPWESALQCAVEKNVKCNKIPSKEDPL